MRRKVCTARRRFQRCQTRRRGQLRTDYLTKDQQYKQLMETTRTKSWIKFISESSAENPWSLAYKIAKDKIFAPKLSELLDCDGNPVIKETQIANKLFNFLFPNDSTCNEIEKQQHIRAQSQGCSYQGDDRPFSQCEVNDVIYYQNPNRAPGEDGITADIIAKTHGINREFLCQL